MMTFKFQRLSLLPTMQHKEMVVHQNVRLSDVTASDVLGSDHLPIFFHVLGHVSAKGISAPVETHRLGAVLNLNL